MKKTSCNLVISYLFFILLSFFIISTSTESTLQITNCTNLQLTPNTAKCTNFTYTESANNTQSQPYVIDIQFYDDGTTLIHLVIDRPKTPDCFEPTLIIRIIHLDGSVTEIDKNFENLTLDSVDYCLFNSTITGKMVNPILIRPLSQQFILVSYLDTHDRWGAVLNWKGEKLSDVNGNSSVLTDNAIDIGFFKVALFTSLATIDEGYAILYAKYSFDETDYMNSLGGLYVSFIGTIQPPWAILSFFFK
ncbi:4261_t:CDS:2 [Dentiscutata erythropus]|uniref:4261_t:CDS:1 n=1 Tax=Dentiscutata erythropus TaxID=1348616 RepID=A0A9N9A768_9GLOM|nr:4261_t:CDS:2 [Dentiscutata erythropus]